MNDPYQILGVTRDASDREIKKAYRDLSRKYHPDSYAGKSEAEANAAAEKFKQVQEAYNRIVDERSGKATGSYGDFGGFGAGQGRQNYSEDEQHMMAAMNYIRARRYNEALNVLNGISNHNAAWYYYSSIANMGLGNNNVALEQAKQAMDMESILPAAAKWRWILWRKPIWKSVWRRLWRWRKLRWLWKLWRRI